MKKLSLKNLKLNESDLLQRNQLKSVFGGYDGGGGCSRFIATCTSGWVGSTNCGSVAQGMLEHCNSSGGTMSVILDSSCPSNC